MSFGRTWVKGESARRILRVGGKRPKTTSGPRTDAVRVAYVATPAGFEGARNSAKPSETGLAPTENQKSGSVTHIDARRGCSKCSKAAHLALIAANAVRNGDLFKALKLLEEVAGGDDDRDSEDIVLRMKNAEDVHASISCYTRRE